MKKLEAYRNELDEIIEKHNFKLSDKIVVQEALRTEKLVFAAREAEI